MSGTLSKLVRKASRRWLGAGADDKFSLSALVDATELKIIADAPLPICPSVFEWLQHHPEIEWKLIREQTEFQRAVPRTVEPQLDSQFLQRSIRVPEFLVAALPNALVRGWRGVIVLPDGSYPSDITFHSAKFLVQEYGYTEPLPENIPFKQGNYFVVPLLWWKNYGHWLIDCMTRLLWARQYLPADIKYIVPLKADETRLEILRLLGIRREQMEFMDARENWRLECLWYAPMATVDGVAPASVLDELAQILLHGLNIEPKQRTRRIYISRKQLANRFLTNEPEVQACFARYGFQSVSPPSLPFAEEVALFAEADIVAENSGAGLTNALFARRGATTLDLIDPNYFNNYAWGFASSLRSPYWYFFGETMPGVTADLPNVRIPIDKLEKTLTEIFRA